MDTINNNGDLSGESTPPEPFGEAVQLIGSIAVGTTDRRSPCPPKEPGDYIRGAKRPPGEQNMYFRILSQNKGADPDDVVAFGD